jgi:nucleoside-diphosphate-sugar epimerase
MSRIALVTGATGFVGSALTARLISEGWEVHGLVRDDGLPLPEGLVPHDLDGTTEGLAAIVAAVEPDVVFHLASLFLATHTPAQVAPLIEANILFGTQLVDAMTSAGCTRLVNTGTVWQHFDGAAYDPVCLYAATKQAFEDILAFYVSAHGLSAVSLYLYDTYGPNDPRPKLFTMLRKMADTGEALAMSPGEQTIDYVYIDDITRAFSLTADRLLSEAEPGHQRFEVRTGRALALREIVETWQRVTGRPLDIEWGGRAYREREVMAPWTGGETLPGWWPQVSLEEGIERMEGIKPSGGSE